MRGPRAGPRNWHTSWVRADSLRLESSRPEPSSFRLDRNGAPDSCLDALSSREPVSTSLENA
ncbi:hypothetical protein DXU07_30180 [Bradyrhizobium elkanii]